MKTNKKDTSGEASVFAGNTSTIEVVESNRIETCPWCKKQYSDSFEKMLIRNGGICFKCDITGRDL